MRRYIHYSLFLCIHHVSSFFVFAHRPVRHSLEALLHYTCHIQSDISLQAVLMLETGRYPSFWTIVAALVHRTFLRYLSPSSHSCSRHLSVHCFENNSCLFTSIMQCESTKPLLHVIPPECPGSSGCARQITCEWYKSDGIPNYYYMATCMWILLHPDQG